MSLLSNTWPKTLLKPLIHRTQRGTGMQSRVFSLILALNSSDMSDLKHNHEPNEIPDFWQI